MVISMKQSRYTLVKTEYPCSDYVLLYNTLTKAVATVRADDWNKIGTSNESNISPDIVSSLLREGIICENEDSEVAKLNMYFTNLKSRYYSYATMILTSYACNMSCPYCFENKIKNNHNTMTAQTARDTAEWLKKEFRQYQPRYAGIAFSGGEPLYNKEAVEIIIRELKEYCDQHDIGFSFGFLTNGTISISDEEAQLYSSCGISFIQYTIDGDRDVNNARRVIDGGSYDIILNNISHNNTIMDVQTIVRVNVDQDNSSHIEGLLDDLKLLNIHNLTIDYAVRFETPCDIYSSNHAVLTARDIPESIINCQKLTKDKGLTHSRRFTSDTPCLAIVPRQFVIDPEGYLYKCAAFAGERDYAVGNIYEENLYKKYIEIVGNDAWHECKECPYVPLCGGGCLFLNRNASGDYLKRKCQRFLFENIVMETLASSLDAKKLNEQLQCKELNTH